MLMKPGVKTNSKVFWSQSHLRQGVEGRVGEKVCVEVSM